MGTGSGEIIGKRKSKKSKTTPAAFGSLFPLSFQPSPTALMISITA
jgi:hypothetical protein